MSARFSVTLPFGAQVSAPGQVRFRVWAPGAEAVAVEIIGRERLPMTPEDAESPALVRAGGPMRSRYALPLRIPDPRPG
ncbi:hypothetical protein J2S30_001173 [Herbaspirillum rubrisubalbicans]|nr:hypothetical protein [Herbaspirillum rubrisubalbicans]MCP1572794.1 hypothetical protein [Herbaspirillum rubrisubalbicans]